MKSISEYINESLINEVKTPEVIHILNNVCDDRSGTIDFKWFPKDHNKYKADSEVCDYLGEIMGATNTKPFSKIDKDVLKLFDIDWKDVEVYRYIVMDPEVYGVGDYEEVILYTPKGEDPEGEDHDYAIEDVFNND